MPKVFLTGSDGLLGSNLVRELIKRNYEVTAMVQTGRQPVTLNNLSVNIVYGDVTNKEQLIQFSNSADYFIHVAALTDIWPTKHSKYHEINVVGTKNAVEAVLQNKIGKMIHVGSASSFGFGTIKEPGNEMWAEKCTTYDLDYIISKKQGQEFVIEAVKKRNLPAVVVCPTFMIGPYDTKPSSGALVLAVIKNKIPALPKGGKNWVAVKDVAVGICNALEKGRIGESYILGGENLSYKDAVKQIAESVGQPSYPTVMLPDIFMKLAGKLTPIFSVLRGIKPDLSYPLACISCDEQFFTSQKAIRELSLPQTPIGEAAKELKYWFEENGYL